MPLPNMNNAETKVHLLKWIEQPPHSPFAWPTDACGYDQHMKFVTHRNNNWQGGSHTEFLQFVKAYAETL